MTTSSPKHSVHILLCVCLIALLPACVPGEQDPEDTLNQDMRMVEEFDAGTSDPDTSDMPPEHTRDKMDRAPDASSPMKDMDEDQAPEEDLTPTMVDPCIVDTDGDTLNDCEEASLGSDPTRIDSDYDGLTDAEEVAMGSSPVHGDSDEDWLTDYEEVQLGTDPLNADTDGDGVSDRDEWVKGLNPLHESSLDNGVLDSDLFIHNACNIGLTYQEPVRMLEGIRDQENWRIVLPATFTHHESVSFLAPQRLQGAKVYEGAQLAGFALSVPTPEVLPIPELIKPYQAKLAQIGTLVQYTTSPYFRSRHAYRTRTATYDVMLDEPLSLLSWRNKVLRTFGEFERSALAEALPGEFGAEESTRFMLKISVIERTDHSVVMVSTMPRALHNPNTRIGRAFSQSADSTNISMRTAQDSQKCTTTHLQNGHIKVPGHLPVSASLVMYRSTPKGDDFEWVPQSRAHGFDYDAVTHSIELFGDYRLPLPSLAACTTDTDCPDQAHERCAHQQCIARQPQHYAIQSMDFWAAKWPGY